MMECQLCGDTQGPWEYEQYLALECIKCKDRIDEYCKKCNPTKINWKSQNGNILLLCEECAKEMRRRRRKINKWSSLYMP